MTDSKWKLTSLLRVEERLLEAEYFVDLMRRQGNADRFGYCLNAFLSAARSVTFLLQKEMAHIRDFSTWWSGQQQLLAKDAAARYFLKLRNYSQKEGRVSIVGSGRGRGRGRRWIYRFAGTETVVPGELLQRDVADCCIEHVSKLARLILACVDRFPFHTCPLRAMTPDGLKALGLTTAELLVALGFEPAWGDAGGEVPLEQQLRILRGHVDGLDLTAINRISRRRPRQRPVSADPGEILGDEIAARLVVQLERQRRAHVPALVGEMLLHSRAGNSEDGPSELPRF